MLVGSLNMAHFIFLASQRRNASSVFADYLATLPDKPHDSLHFSDVSCDNFQVLLDGQVFGIGLLKLKFGIDFLKNTTVT